MTKDEKQQTNSIVIEGYDEAQLVFTNQVAIGRISDDEAELILSVLGANNKAKVTHRIMVTLPHLFRIKDLLVNITNEIEKQLRYEDTSSKE